MNVNSRATISTKKKTRAARCHLDIVARASSAAAWSGPWSVGVGLDSSLAGTAERLAEAVSAALPYPRAVNNVSIYSLDTLLAHR